LQREPLQTGGIDWDDAQMAVQPLWQSGVTGGGVRVAVVDTGVDDDHPFFEGRVRTDLAHDVVSDRRDCQGVNPDGTLISPYDLTDCFGHGTEMAGVAAANGSTQWGPIRGIAYRAEVVPVKVFYLRQWYDWHWGWEVIDPGDVIAHGFYVVPGESFIDIELEWTNGNNDFLLSLTSPTGRVWNGVPNPARFGTGRVVRNVPIGQECVPWTVEAASLPGNSPDNVHIRYFTYVLSAENVDIANGIRYAGEHAQPYHFRCRARDHAGNEELYPDVADAWTIVDAQPPSTTVEPLDLYTFTTSFTVRWHGADDLSGLDHYDIYYRDESQAGWVLWLQEVTGTQATFLGSPGHTYHFCSRGVDNAGNAENCPPACIEGDRCGWPIQGDAQIGIAPWSRVDDLPPYTAQTTFSVCWSGIDEQWYDVYVRDGLYGGWGKWKKNTVLTCGSFTGAYGHVYYFYSVGKSEEGAEQPPYDWDAYTKLVAPTEGEGAAGGGGALVLLPPDEAPDRMEEVTRTQAIGVLLSGTIAPQGDVDWYRFELTKTLRLRVRLYDLPADYDLYVFDGSGRFRWASTWGRRLPEEVVVRVPAGVYYVRLAGYAGAWSGEVPYRLLVERPP
jgi:hypothetical protein